MYRADRLTVASTVFAPAERERRRYERHEESPPRSDRDHHRDERQQAREHLAWARPDGDASAAAQPASYLPPFAGGCWV